MKTVKLILLLLICLLVSLGCDEDEYNSPDVPAPPPHPEAIALSINPDTLRFLPGDSASAEIAVIVSDQQGNVMEGQRVGLALSESQLGFISFLNPLLRDTTNAHGRVDMLFTAIGIEGDEIFTASVGDITGTRVLAVRVIPTMVEVEIDWPPPQAAIGQEPWLEFDILYTLTDGTPLAGRQLTAACTSGRLPVILPPTNADGRTTGRIVDNDQFGLFCVTVTDGFTEGTDCAILEIGGG